MIVVAFSCEPSSSSRVFLCEIVVFLLEKKRFDSR
nr:MAG TPA: hypothetical protein [Caudoviricetes sp.]